jgi:hypothetical protein
MKKGVGSAWVYPKGVETEGRKARGRSDLREARQRTKACSIHFPEDEEGGGEGAARHAPVSVIFRNRLTRYAPRPSLRLFSARRLVPSRTRSTCSRLLRTLSLSVPSPLPRPRLRSAVLRIKRGGTASVERSGPCVEVRGRIWAKWRKREGN